jgi:hypothetical protein
MVLDMLKAFISRCQNLITDTTPLVEEIYHFELAARFEERNLRLETAMFAFQMGCKIVLPER